jgi:type I restriction enzyme, R subunit
MFARSKEVLSKDEVTDRLKEAEYALEVKVIKDQSEADKNYAEAFSNVINSTKDIPNIALKIGSLIIIKTTSETGEASVVSRNLTILELHLLNKRPDLMLKPKEILNALASINQDDAIQN